ncbi:Rac/Rho-like_protein [Hexamita inflata]|uniref:Rac/Rho-like protein n=1 Tax=Hexamita inflata TaxID=28002 RepID=A0AA86UNX2_9EUKA|nr:Rac/Rho-like protein [Hexamita inflata]
MNCILVGDRTVGKSSLATLLQTGRFYQENVPTVHDIVRKTIIHNSQSIKYYLWDSSNNNVYDNSISILYRKADVVLVCYAVDNIISFNNTVSKWIPEIKQFMPSKPFILVGLKSDLRFEKDSVCEQEAKTVADKFNAQTHIYCSSLINNNINLLLSTTIQIQQNWQMLHAENTDQK